MKILGLIPARGNSKGLPKKNLYPIKGRPLIYYTIKASLGSKYITDTYVSSDDDKILKISADLGANTLRRPDEYATDTSSTHSVIKDAIDQLKKNNKIYDVIVLLQPTSPLRDNYDIDSALEILFKHNCDSVISVYNIGYKPFKSYYRNTKGYLGGIFNDTFPNMRRQDLPDAFMANGAIYIINTKTFIKFGKLITKKTLPYIMDKEKSHDIDVLEDIIKLEEIM
jgi:CMP-N,N'-diacetyllegionaminic acid synthase